MSTPNITALTSFYAGTGSFRSAALINQTPDSGGSSDQLTTLTFYGVPQGGTITSPAVVGILKVQRIPGQPATGSAGEVVFSANNGSGAQITSLTLTSSGVTAAVPVFSNTYDTVSGSSVFKSAGTTALTLSSSSAVFAQPVNVPNLTLTNANPTIGTTANNLTFAVAGVNAISLTTTGALLFSGSAPVVNSVNPWAQQVGGVNYLQFGASTLSVGSTIPFVVPSSVAINGAASSTKLLVSDASAVAVLTVDTTADLVTVAALKISTLTTGILVSNASGAISSSNGTGLTFTNSTLAGSTALTGTLTQSGGGAITFTGAVTMPSLNFSGLAPTIAIGATSVLSFTVNNTSYFSIGDGLVSGTLALQTSGMASATKFQVLDPLNAAVFTVDTSADKVIVNQTLSMPNYAVGLLSVVSGGNVVSGNSNLTLSGTILTGDTTLNGAQSSTKLRVLTSLGAAVLTVDTTASKVIVGAGFQIASLGAGILSADSSGNVSSSSTGLTLTGTTLAGTTTFTGALTQSGTGAVTFAVTPSAPGLLLTNSGSIINTSGSSLTLSVLDAPFLTIGGGSSNITTAAPVVISGTASTTKFQVLDATSASVLTVDTSGKKVIAVAAQITNLGAGNVISDGSGNLSIGSTGLTFTNTTLAGTTLVNGTASATKFVVANASAASVLTVNTSTNVVALTSLQITSLVAGILVTDGSGNVTSATSGLTLNNTILTGLVTMSGLALVSGTASSSKFVVQNASAASVLTVDTSSNKVVANALQISTLGAGNLVSDGSGNVSVNSTGLTFTTTTLAGTTTLTGPITQTGGGAISLSGALTLNNLSGGTPGTHALLATAPASAATYTIYFDSTGAQASLAAITAYGVRIKIPFFQQNGPAGQQGGATLTFLLAGGGTITGTEYNYAFTQSGPGATTGNSTAAANFPIYSVNSWRNITDDITSGLSLDLDFWWSLSVTPATASHMAVSCNVGGDKGSNAVLWQHLDGELNEPNGSTQNIPNIVGVVIALTNANNTVYANGVRPIVINYRA